MNDLQLYAYQILQTDLKSLKVAELRNVAMMLGKENNKLTKAKLIEYIKCLAVMVYQGKSIKPITKPTSLPLTPEYCPSTNFTDDAWRQHLAEHG